MCAFSLDLGLQVCCTVQPIHSFSQLICKQSALPDAVYAVSSWSPSDVCLTWKAWYQASRCISAWCKQMLSLAAQGQLQHSYKNMIIKQKGREPCTALHDE